MCVEPDRRGRDPCKTGGDTEMLLPGTYAGPAVAGCADSLLPAPPGVSQQRQCDVPDGLW